MPKLLSLLLLVAVMSSGAQAQDILGTGPRGNSESPVPLRAPTTSPPAAQAASAKPELPPLPADPSTSAIPLMFGTQMFSGRFAAESVSGFNAEHQVSVGDRIALRLWGAVQLETVQSVDAQGNAFIANVGPVRVAGVRNGDLNRQVEAQVKRTFRASVGVYAALEGAQPVKVYVTGFVRAPGLYGGLSSDSVLAYLDRAGGIDAARGSYLEVDVLRAGKRRARIALYRFLLEGQIDTLQLIDGDTIVATPRKHTVHVKGEALNPYVFEFAQSEVSAAKLLQMARPRPNATHMSIVRRTGAERRSEYHALSDAAQVMVRDGDELTLTSDKYPGTILVRIDGAHLGQRTVVLPYGATLKDATALIKPAPQSDLASLKLFRRSVAERQKVLMETTLQRLETYALTSRSATSEEAALRAREAQQILEFIERARRVEPKGQVVLAQAAAAKDVLLEDGDQLIVPEANQLVTVSGEVLFPTAVVHDDRADLETYVRRAGGYTQGADKARVVVMRRDGSLAESTRGILRPGDEVLVLPKVETKSVEVTRGITQIIYQIAVAAKVVFGL